VAALESERAGGLGNAVPVSGQFAQDRLALEGRHTVGERTAAASGDRIARTTIRDHLADRVRVDRIVGQQQQALDDIPKLADVSGPRVTRELVESVRCEPRGFQLF
jgi:hypothetical protein